MDKPTTVKSKVKTEPTLAEIKANANISVAQWLANGKAAKRLADAAPELAKAAQFIRDAHQENEDGTVTISIQSYRELMAALDAAVAR